MAIKLFCKHVYKVISVETLEEGILVDFDGDPVGKYEIVGVTRECLKCGKKKITEQRSNNRGRECWGKK